MMNNKTSKNKNGALSMAQKGFSFTLKAHKKGIGVKCGKCKAAMERPDYLVIGHQVGNEKYYIECYHIFHEVGIHVFRFSAEITGKGGYDALEESVLQFINEYDMDCNATAMISEKDGRKNLHLHG